jgi:hypothetical protein
VRNQSTKDAEYAEYDLLFLAHCNPPAQKLRTLVLLHPSCTDFEQEQKHAEPDVSHPHLERIV